MRKVLIIAYHFPPSNAVGALRPARFAEYLPEFGWQPIVLTAPAEPSPGPWQFDRMEDVPAEVVRPWPGLRDMWLGLKRRAAGSKERDDAQGRGDWAAAFDAARTRGGPSVRLRELAYALMSLPDDRHGWILPAVYRGLELVRRNRISAVLATSPPQSALLVGFALSKLGGLPLLVDFRDPWTGNPAVPAYLRDGGVGRVHAFLERRVLRRSAAVITATDEHAGRIRGRPAKPASPVRSIPNGFDASVFSGLEVGGGDRFTITYAGNLYHSRDPAPILHAIDLLVRRGALSPERIVLRLIGDCEYANGRRVVDVAADLGLAESVDVVGRLPHREAVAALLESDLLLLLASDQAEQIPTKAYEYLAAGRPMLAVLETGATARLVRRGDADIVDDASPARIADVLERRIREWTPVGPDGWTCPPEAARYERRNTVAALAELIDVTTVGTG